MKTILATDAALRSLVAKRVNDFMPAARAFLYDDVNANDFVLDSSRIAQITEIVNAIKAQATPGLQQELDAFVQALSAQQGKKGSEALGEMLLLD